MYSSAYNGSDVIFVSRITTNKNPDYTSLRSHEIDNMVILVENSVTLDVHLKSYLILSIPIMLAVWIFFRMAFRFIANEPRRDFWNVIMDTWGCFLSTNTSFTIRNHPEQVMNISILLLSVLTSRLAAAILFNYLLANEVESGIDTMKELYEHNIEIYISEEMEMTMGDWSQNL